MNNNRRLFVWMCDLFRSICRGMCVVLIGPLLASFLIIGTLLFLALSGIDAIGDGARKRTMNGLRSVFEWLVVESNTHPGAYGNAPTGQFKEN